MKEYLYNVGGCVIAARTGYFHRVPKEKPGDYFEPETAQSAENYHNHYVKYSTPYSELLFLLYIGPTKYEKYLRASADRRL